MIAIYVLMLKMHTLKIFHKLNRRNIFEFKEIKYTTEVSLSKPFFPTNTNQFMSSEGNVKAMDFKIMHGESLFLCFNFISAHKKLEKLHHKFHYTHTP